MFESIQCDSSLNGFINYLKFKTAGSGSKCNIELSINYGSDDNLIGF